MATQVKLAEKLRKFREDRGFNQIQMAEKMDIPYGTYIQAETNSSMGDDVMRKILNYMHEEKKS